MIRKIKKIDNDNLLTIIFVSVLLLFLIFIVIFLYNKKNKFNFILASQENTYHSLKRRGSDNLSENQILKLLRSNFLLTENVQLKIYQEDIFLIMERKKIIGFARVIYKDIICSVCTDIKVLGFANFEGKLIKIILINKISLYGEKIDGVEFLKQFCNKNYEQIKEFDNMDIITGATISCKLIYEGIKDFLFQVTKTSNKIRNDLTFH